MPKKNMTKSPKLSRSEKDKRKFECQAHAFIEEHYQTLMKYARYLTYRNEDKAHDLLHHTLLVLLEGGVSIDFQKSPLTYFNLLMKREKERQGRVRQAKFEQDMIYSEDHNTIGSDTEVLSTKHFSNADQAAVKDWVIDERRGATSVEVLIDRFPLLIESLSLRNKEILKWHLKGSIQRDIGDHFGITSVRVGQLLRTIKTSIKERGTALLQAEPADDRG